MLFVVCVVDEIVTPASHVLNVPLVSVTYCDKRDNSDECQCYCRCYAYCCCQSCCCGGALLEVSHPYIVMCEIDLDAIEFQLL